MYLILAERLFNRHETNQVYSVLFELDDISANIHYCIYSMQLQRYRDLLYYSYSGIVMCVIAATAVS